MFSCLILLFTPMESEMLDASISTFVGRNSSCKNYLFLGKVHIEIRKFDGSNSALWKNKMRDVLVPRKQTRPLGGKAKKPDDMDDDDSEELDALIMSTIRLHLADNVYVTVLDNKKMSKKFGKSYAIHMRRKLQQTKCFL